MQFLLTPMFSFFYFPLALFLPLPLLFPPFLSFLLFPLIPTGFGSQKRNAFRSTIVPHSSRPTKILNGSNRRSEGRRRSQKEATKSLGITLQVQVREGDESERARLLGGGSTGSKRRERVLGVTAMTHAVTCAIESRASRVPLSARQKHCLCDPKQRRRQPQPARMQLHLRSHTSHNFTLRRLQLIQAQRSRRTRRLRFWREDEKQKSSVMTSAQPV